MSKISFSKFVWAMAAILWTFTPQAPAQAQSTLLNALSSSGVYRILNSSDAVYSRSFTTDASATVTSMVVRVANSGLQNSGTLSAGIYITVGGNVRFSNSFQNELGEVSLSGEIGYQADMSDDTVARAFLLGDPSTVYEYRMDADDDEQSLSHSNLVLSASLLTETEWLFNASFDFFGYEAGTLTGLTVSASRAF